MHEKGNEFKFIKWYFFVDLQTVSEKSKELTFRDTFFFFAQKSSIKKRKVDFALFVYPLTAIGRLGDILSKEETV